MNELNHPQPNEPGQKTKNLWTIIVLVIIIAAMVGAGVYMWQRNDSETAEQKPKQENTALQDKINDQQALTQADYVNNETINEMPIVSLVKESSSCEQNNSYAKFKILINNSQAASVTVAGCESSRGEVLAIKNDSAYFSILPEGLGGYILYGKYANLYRLSFADNSVATIIGITGQVLLTDIEVSRDLSLIAYSRGNPNSIIVKNLNNSRENTYVFSEISNDAQFGGFKFSPNQDKLAIAVGHGPDRERGEIYILNLQSGLFSLYRQTSLAPIIKGWVSNNQVDWD